MLGQRETHREGDQQADGDASGDGDGGLPVVLRGEDVGVLQCAVGCGGQCVDQLGMEIPEMPLQELPKEVPQVNSKKPR